MIHLLLDPSVFAPNPEREPLFQRLLQRAETQNASLYISPFGFESLQAESGDAPGSALLERLLERTQGLAVLGSEARQSFAAGGSATVFRQSVEERAFLRACPGDAFGLTVDERVYSGSLRWLRPEELDAARPVPRGFLVPGDQYRDCMEASDEALLRNAADAAYIMGPDIRRLESEMQKYLGAAHCAGVSSGTDALVLALRALSLEKTGQEFWTDQDLVLTTPFTFTATGDAILRAGARPLFCDIDPNTLNLDAEAVRRALNNLPAGHRAVGLIPVHLYGSACDLDALLQIAADHGLFIVEDVAQAMGSQWRGRRLGTLGDAGAYSFFPSKNLGAMGDGGLVACRRSETDELVRMLIKHGGRDKYNVQHVGYNARLDTLQAGVLLAKLPALERYQARRNAIAGRYREALREISGIQLPDVPRDCDPAFHQFTALAPEGRRDATLAFLKERGVPGMVYYPTPLHRMEVFGKGRSIQANDLRHSEAASRRVFSLPIDPLQSAADGERAIDALHEFYKLEQNANSGVAPEVRRNQ